MTTETTTRSSVLRTVLLVGLSLGLVAGACETPPPSPADGGADALAADRAAEDEGGDAAVDPAERPLLFVDGKRATQTGDWVDDDAPAPPAIRDLDPEDIESIRVLKGEEAVDAYGEEAASGVLLITTKEGAASSG